MTKTPRKGRSLASMIEPQDNEPARTIGFAEMAAQDRSAEVALRARQSLQGVNLSTVISKADHKRLKQLSLDAETSMQQLGLRAWTLLLAEHGLPPLEHHTANRPSGGKNR